MPTGKQNDQCPSLTVGQASRLLGVSEVTLRQWTDNGRIRAFVTPGGHRRYAESQLRHFVGTEQQIHGIRDMIARMKLAPSVQMELAHTQFARTFWYRRLDENGRAHLGGLGRRLHRLVITYLTKKKKRVETIELARQVGRDFGEYLAEIGLSLTDALEAFILHRAPLINAAIDLIRRREAIDEHAAEAIPLVAQITDEALLSLVAAYHKGTNNDREADRPGPRRFEN